MRRYVTLLAVLAFSAIGTVTASLASDIHDVENRLIGHPKARFPLTIYAESAPAPALNSSIHDAVAQWNDLFEQLFGRAAFIWTRSQTSAGIVIRFANASRVKGEMGETDVDADKQGIIRLPVKITLIPPKSRGRTDARRVLFDVAAHELGHALGLPHINKADSIMCCDPGAINFSDMASRAAYIQARQHPDLRSVAPDLAAHYRKFWNENGVTTKKNPPSNILYAAFVRGAKRATALKLNAPRARSPFAARQASPR